ncbi:Hypothetical predicted protein [Podarcis lilfordi]|uniref:Uncharacterized protein n=1 Tax=Podarcis lilfordi TaxID=74358 RepID=A0AA35PE50_9SAUR|nr:Hypothetical predicted protein [Podarcis lilfordi]
MGRFCTTEKAVQGARKLLFPDVYCKLTEGNITVFFGMKMHPTPSERKLTSKRDPVFVIPAFCEFLTPLRRPERSLAEQPLLRHLLLYRYGLCLTLESTLCLNFHCNSWICQQL